LSNPLQKTRPSELRQLFCVKQFTLTA